MRLVISTVISETKDFARSHTVTYTKCGSILEMMNDGVVATTGHS